MFTPRSYPTVEIAIDVENRPPEFKQEGDIATIRPPNIGIGLKEAKNRIWLLVDGLEQLEFSNFHYSVLEPYDATGAYHPHENYTRYDRRRYCVPLDRLQTVFPSLDLNRARDMNDAYQPFFTLDEDNYLWLTDRIPLSVEGLVFDKVIGDYL